MDSRACRSMHADIQRAIQCKLYFTPYGVRYCACTCSGRVWRYWFLRGTKLVMHSWVHVHGGETVQNMEGHRLSNNSFALVTVIMSLRLLKISV